MKKTVLLSLLVLVSCAVFAQNGPTKPSVALSFTQSTGSTNAIAKNCLYRGLASGVYQLPALQCSTTPVVAFTDAAVTRGQTYFYAVTAVDSKGAESQYSGEVGVQIPIINAPSGLGSGAVTLKLPAVITISKDGKLVARAQ